MQRPRNEHKVVRIGAKVTTSKQRCVEMGQHFQKYVGMRSDPPIAAKLNKVSHSCAQISKHLHRQANTCKDDGHAQNHANINKSIQIRSHMRNDGQGYATTATDNRHGHEHRPETSCSFLLCSAAGAEEH
jgi:hypothetical protein